MYYEYKLFVNSKILKLIDYKHDLFFSEHFANENMAHLKHYFE